MFCPSCGRDRATCVAGTADSAGAGAVCCGHCSRILKVAPPPALCTCQPRADGLPDFGQAWSFKADFTGPMICSRCRGAMRPDQDLELAAAWVKGMALPSPKPFSVD